MSLHSRLRLPVAVLGTLVEVGLIPEHDRGLQFVQGAGGCACETLRRQPLGNISQEYLAAYIQCFTHMGGGCFVGDGGHALQRLSVQPRPLYVQRLLCLIKHVAGVALLVDGRVYGEGAPVLNDRRGLIPCARLHLHLEGVPLDHVEGDQIDMLTQDVVAHRVRTLPLADHL